MIIYITVEYNNWWHTHCIQICCFGSWDNESNHSEYCGSRFLTTWMNLWLPHNFNLCECSPVSVNCISDYFFRQNCFANPSECPIPDVHRCGTNAAFIKKKQMPSSSLHYVTCKFLHFIDLWKLLWPFSLSNSNRIWCVYLVQLFKLVCHRNSSVGLFFCTLLPTFKEIVAVTTLIIHFSPVCHSPLLSCWSQENWQRRARQFSKILPAL